MWDKNEIHSLVEAQRAFFREGTTLDVDWRIEQLKKLKNSVRSHAKELESALHKDLGRCDTESFLCDIGPVILEINETIRGLRRWARPETKFSGPVCVPSHKTKIYKMPYGVTLIISPFNFPFMLSLGVLVSSIAGGNTAVIKASSKSPNCTRLLQQMISEIYPPQFVAVVDGGHDTADLCLEERFDKIFYTGSPKVGAHVMGKAAVNLTPVALELGGENGNWCVIRADADLKDAAHKIAFFKMMNAGQVCININQIAVAEEVADEFLKELTRAFKKQIGKDALKNKDYPHLISKAAYDRCVSETALYRDRVIYGGNGDPGALRFQPTVIYPVSVEEPIVNHELFSPLLPVVPYKDREIDSFMKTIAKREHGLALYIFTGDKKWASEEMQRQQFGGGCVNEVCMHMMVKGAPFGGTGHSGIGAYHGEWGFREFTHASTVLYGKTHMNVTAREHPYNRKIDFWKKPLLQLFER